MPKQESRVMGSKIKSVHARQIFSDRGHPGIEATVTTEDGKNGTAMVTAGQSVGKFEVQFVYDGGERWAGMGVQKAVDNVDTVIAPAIKGMAATKQREIDETMLKLDGTPNKTKLGGNATASVSAAVLKAGAASLEIPLYQHIGGVNACLLPVVGAVCVVGSDRYGGGKRSGGKPSYAFMAYGFKTFSEASYACWDIERQFSQLVNKKLKIKISSVMTMPLIPPGAVNSDRDLWNLMTEAINGAGYRNKVGIQVDIAAGTYYEAEKDRWTRSTTRDTPS